MQSSPVSDSRCASDLGESEWRQQHLQVHVAEETSAPIADTQNAVLSMSLCTQVCHRLGMWPMASESWEALYSRPLPTLLCTLAALLLVHVTYGILFLGGVSWKTWSITIPETLFIFYGLYLFVGFYFCGPRINRMPWTPLTTFTSAPLLVYLSLAPFVGGIAIVPFNSRAITAIVMSFGIYGLYVVGQVLAHEQKAEDSPKLALERALAVSAMGTIRGMNNMTDFGFVRVLVEQVQRSECFWFGAPAACSKYVALAVLATTFPAIAIAKEIVNTLGTQEARKYEKRQRYLRPIILLSQLGEVVVTLLKLFSDASTAAKLTAAGEDKASLRREVAFQFVSCGFSIATFIVTAIGLHKVMLAVHTTSVRVSKRVSNAATALRMRTMGTGAVHPTGGQRTAMHLQPAGTHQMLDLEQEGA